MAYEENEKRWELYNKIYNKYPEEHSQITKQIGRRISYDFIEPRLIKDWGTTQQGRYKCVEYAKIIPKIKWPDMFIENSLRKNIYLKNKYDLDDDSVPFLIAGTVIRMTRNKKGRYTVLICDDEKLWNNPDDYSQLTFLDRMKENRYCIKATELFDCDKYSIGAISDLRPGKRVMMSVFNLTSTSNDKWLQADFTDIGYCSKDVSFRKEYTDIHLDSQYKMISTDEYLNSFFDLAQQNETIQISGLKTANGSSSGEGCYIATCVYGSYDCPQVWTLRRFRDNTLAKTCYGRAFISLYYAISPTIVRIFGDTKWFKALWKKPLDKLVNRLKLRGFESTEYRDKQ